MKIIFGYFVLFVFSFLNDFELCAKTRLRRCDDLTRDLLQIESVPSQFSQFSMNDLWQEYSKHPSEPLRNYLIERNSSLVLIHAGQLKVKLPPNVSIEELYSAGIDGLIDAIEKFDLERGVEFSTYAASRIRGAMIDALREMGVIKRNYRKHGRSKKASEEFFAANGRPPSLDELIAILSPQLEALVEADISRWKKVGLRGDTPTSKKEAAMRERFRKRRIAAMLRPRGQTYSLNDSINPNDLDAPQSIELLVEPGSNHRVLTGVLANVQSQTLKALLQEDLTRVERLIIELYFYKGMTMKETGVPLDLSESRVSQLLKSIIERLKVKLAGREDEFVIEER